MDNRQHVKKITPSRAAVLAAKAAALGVIILITMTIFGLGFWAGVASTDTSRDRGTTFEQPISKVMSEPLPKELP